MSACSKPIKALSQSKQFIFEINHWQILSLYRFKTNQGIITIETIYFCD